MLMWCQQWCYWPYEVRNGEWKVIVTQQLRGNQSATAVSTWVLGRGGSTKTAEGQKDQNTQKQKKNPTIKLNQSEIRLKKKHSL